MSKALTLLVPDTLYERLQSRAVDERRSVEDEVLEAVAMALPMVDDLPSEIVTELAALDELDDDRLWQVAQRTLEQRDDRRLRSLARRQGRTSLRDSEEQELRTLLDRLEDVGLIRARAAALLAERGHDVGALLPR